MLSGAAADTVTLHDGKVFEGKVLAENDQEVRMDVQVNERTKRRMTFPRLDVRSVRITPQSQIDFENLPPLVPTPDFLPVDGYDNRLAEIEGYLRKHSTGPSVLKAERIKRKLEAEKQKAASGQVRLNGTWFTKEAQQANLVDFDAGRDLQLAQTLASQGRYPEALALYDLFLTVYATTPSALTAVEERKDALQTYGRALQELKREHPRLTDVLEKNLERLKSSDAARLREEVALREAAHKSAMEEAKKARAYWFPVDAYDMDSIEHNLERVLTQLRKAPSDKEPIEVNAIYRSVFGQIKDGKGEEAKRELNSLRNAPDAEKYYDLLLSMIEPDGQ